MDMALSSPYIHFPPFKKISLSDLNLPTYHSSQAVACLRPINTESYRHVGKFFFQVAPFSPHPTLEEALCLIWISRHKDMKKRQSGTIYVFIEGKSVTWTGEWRQPADKEPKEYLSDQCLHSYSHPGVFCCSYMKYNDDMSMYTFLAPLCLPLISCVNIIATVTCNYCLWFRIAAVTRSGWGQWWMCCHNDAHV